MIIQYRFLNVFFLVLSVSLLPAVSMAAEGERLLEKFLTETKTMTASFVQTLRASDGEVLQQSSGRFYLHRPGKFRWNYSAPYEQEIVSDGDNVWIHDIDLQQVTVQKQSVSLSNTPMALMQGKVKLDEAYRVTPLDERDGIYRLKLSSKSGDADFAEVVVGVDKSGLRFMQLHDQFEQVTDIVFDDRRSNDVLASELFDFVPPEGVDIFGGS